MNSYGDRTWLPFGGARVRSRPFLSGYPKEDMVMRRIRRAAWIGLLGIIASAVLTGITGTSASAAAPCHDPNIGGDFYCSPGDFRSGEAWQDFPNGSVEVFVVGSNKALWTRWTTGTNSSGGWSNWASLGGQCPCGYAPGLLKSGEGTWHPTVIMIGSDYNGWYRSRSNSGGWSGWWCCHNSGSDVTKGHRPSWLGG
jgi:hypothetical protein